MVKKKFMIFLFLFVNFFGTCYSETKPYSKLENDIAKNLRCLICQGQSIYDSNSEFALSMRIYIKDQIDRGHSKDQIYNMLVKKYGQWIVYDPGYSKKTFLLWFMRLNQGVDRKPSHERIQAHSGPWGSTQFQSAGLKAGRAGARQYCACRGCRRGHLRAP